MWDYYDVDYEEIDVSNIRFLYQLRHYSNVLGDGAVMKAHNISHRNFSLLKYSSIHGSKNIELVLKNDDYSVIKDWLDEASEVEEAKQRARQKNNKLKEQLEYYRDNICGIGTNKLKRRLNRLAKTNDLAKAVRIALEIEDVNVQAKHAGYYADKKYKQKEQYLVKLVELFKEKKWRYGYESSDVPSATYIYYFHIPGCEQLSWHSNAHILSKPYDGEWDKKEASTFIKLEDFIIKNFSEILEKK